MSKPTDISKMDYARDLKRPLLHREDDTSFERAISIFVSCLIGAATMFLFMDFSAESRATAKLDVQTRECQEQKGPNGAIVYSPITKSTMCVMVK